MKDLLTKRTDDRLSTEIRDGRTLLELARGWLAQGNPVVAMELLKSATDSTDAGSDSQLKGMILKETGRAMMMQSDWEPAETYYVAAQGLLLELDDRKGAAECARNRANMYFQRGKYGEAENLCQKALEWITALNDHQLRATILNTLGAIQSTTGEQKESIKTFKLCLADFQASGNTIRQGYALLNIGLTQTDMGEYVNAIKNLKESLAIAYTEKDLHLLETCYQNIASCHLAEKETILARSVLDTARKVLPGLNSRALETELDLIDSRIQRAMGDLDGAEAMLKTTYQAAKEHDLTALQADVLFEQGLLAKDKGDAQVATCKLDAAANQYQQLGMDKGFREAIGALKSIQGNIHA